MTRERYRMVTAPEPCFSGMVGWEFERLRDGRLKWTAENGATITLTLRPVDLGRCFEELLPEPSRGER